MVFRLKTYVGDELSVTQNKDELHVETSCEPCEWTWELDLNLGIARDKRADNMDREKFQQKAVKQTKQKKSTSAEFLMVKEYTEATEGVGNPGFNMSSPDLSAHRTLKEKVIRHDMLDHTLAAHQQKSRLPASAGPKGNEYSRNYFDPQEEEEINSRQCRMEVSRQDGRSKEETLDQESLRHSSESLDTCKEGEEDAPAYTEESERQAQRGAILLVGSSSTQDLEFERKGLSQDIPMSCLKKEKAFEKALREPCTVDGNPYTKGSDTERRSFPDMTKESRRADGTCWKGERVLPQRKAMKPGLSFLFELFLLHGTHAYNDLIMGWAVFPVCDNNFHIVEGKFKCPILRGPYDPKLDSFRKIENLICQDLDQWLCNLYFKVIKTPLHLDDQKSHENHRQLFPEHPVCLTVEAENTESHLDKTASPSKKEPPGNINAVMGCTIHSSQGNTSSKTDPCPRGCDLCLFKEAHDLHAKGDSLAARSMKERSTVWKPGDSEDDSRDMSYLEELEKHRFSVCCPSSVCGSGRLSKHLHFALMSLFSELELAQWQSQSFWYILLMIASVWFLRLYLHYLGQWLFLRVLSTPVTKFQFYSYTVELCYLTSSLHVGEELAVIILGPLALNTITFPLLLIRWGCQLLFSSCPDALSKLIITMGLWTVLDPLAVFLVDAFLGRLAHNGETPIADAAKLYWMFLRTKQPATLGALITVVAYTLLFVISSLILYVYCLRYFSRPEEYV
ncbi:Ojoplano variant A [Apodemus speciosus]|uniref:Ojoplano variant A n=1 Tax=Apodemus speciosus TaxID=105296 RepID=A0ABQ0FFS7_APOSI